MNTFPAYSGFCDLNIPALDNFDRICDKLIELNYRVVAVNQTFDDAVFTPIRKKKKQENDLVPHPFNVSAPEHVKDKLQVLNRLTVTISEPAHLQRVAQLENFNKYHLIALIPQSEAVFQHACTSKLVDMISFDSSCPQPFRINRRLYNIAVNQSVYFEVPYAPCIYSSKSRSYVIYAAHRYHATGKSKNIVVTSAADNIFQLRGPYDVVALGNLFGLNGEQSKSSITHNCKSLLLRAEGRRLGRVVMTIRISDMGHNNAYEDEDDMDNVLESKRHCADTQMNHVTINKDTDT